jgi:translation initiation factor IF-1
LRSPIADLNDRVPVQPMPLAVTLGDVIKRYEEDFFRG